MENQEQDLKAKSKEGSSLGLYVIIFLFVAAFVGVVTYQALQN